MKINKGIIFGIIGIVGILLVAISVYVLTGTHMETNITESNQLAVNSHNEHDMSNEGQVNNIIKPTMPGQEAFGSIQEIIGILENDPNTDWSKVDIPALNVHLIDMNELTLYANVEENELENGLEMKVIGKDRTIDAIHRMVPTHVEMTLNYIDEWDIQIEKLDNGVILTTTTQNPKEVEHIKGLGFIGLMATGADHPTHHLMMAKGEMH